jgi:DNA-binding MarR family transcriptional regulator
MSLIGNLSDVALADVLRLFAASGKTGLLTASGPGSRQTLIRLNRGTIVHATAGRLQGDDAILDLFGWKEGQLAFVPEEKSIEPNVTLGVDVLILEGVRTGDAFHRMNELIPHDRVVFQTAPGPAADKQYLLGAREWSVLRAVDGVRDVRDLQEASGRERPDVARILFELAEAGFLEPVDAQKTLRAQLPGRFARETAEVDDRLEQEWRLMTRFLDGIARVEVRNFSRKARRLPVAFRSGLGRDIVLPRSIFSELGLREGEDVHVRPVA